MFSEIVQLSFMKSFVVFYEILPLSLTKTERGNHVVDAKSGDQNIQGEISWLSCMKFRWVKFYEIRLVETEEAECNIQEMERIKTIQGRVNLRTPQYLV